MISKRTGWKHCPTIFPMVVVSRGTPAPARLRLAPAAGWG